MKKKLVCLPPLARKTSGGPGSGKPGITEILTEILDYFDLKVKKYAATGIAATLMQDAVTFNSGLFIPVPKKGESTTHKLLHYV